MEDVDHLLLTQEHGLALTSQLSSLDISSTPMANVTTQTIDKPSLFNNASHSHLNVVEVKGMVMEVAVASTINNMLLQIVQLPTMVVHNVRFVTSVIRVHFNVTVGLINYIKYHLPQLLISHVQTTH